MHEEPPFEFCWMLFSSTLSTHDIEQSLGVEGGQLLLSKAIPEPSLAPIDALDVAYFQLFSGNAHRAYALFEAAGEPWPLREPLTSPNLSAALRDLFKEQRHLLKKHVMPVQANVQLHGFATLEDWRREHWGGFNEPLSLRVRDECGIVFVDGHDNKSARTAALHSLQKRFPSWDVAGISLNRVENQQSYYLRRNNRPPTLMTVQCDASEPSWLQVYPQAIREFLDA